MKTKILETDLLAPAEFAKVRDQRRKDVLEIKRHRRVAVGPDVTFYFENYDTLWWQIQEMLHIEKGGHEQMQDELLAYNPLVPQGHELVSTVMIEIENPERRAIVLSSLGYFEDHLVMRFGDHVVHGVPEEDVERTTADGKTSSVHFIHWPFTLEMIQVFKTPGCDVIIECTHPMYSQKTIIPESVRMALMKDFA